MFQATLGHRDPEGWLRWTIAVVGLTGFVLSTAHTVLAWILMAWVRYVLAWVWVLLLGGPPPPLPITVQPPLEFVELVVPEDDAQDVLRPFEGGGDFDLAEPEALIGEAPAPVDPTLPEPIFEVGPGEIPRARLLAEVEATSGLLAMIGTTGDSGGGVFSDVLAGGEVAGLLGSIDDAGSGGLGLRGAGSGGGGVGLGSLGSSSARGGSGVVSVGAGGMGTASARTVRGSLPEGHDTIAFCTVQVDPDARRARDRLQVSGCPGWAHEAARAEVERAGEHTKAGRVRVVLR